MGLESAVERPAFEIKNPIPQEASSGFRQARHFETIALGSTHGVDPSPKTGLLLTDRYRLIEDIDPAHPGRTFHAEDIASSMRVTVQVLHGEPAALEQIEQEADRNRSALHPNFVRVVAVEHAKNFSFVVL